jgi:phosphoglycerate kinase
MKNLVMPVDVVIADEKTKTKVRYHSLCCGNEVCEKNEMILDIGPETVKKYSELIRKARTVVWGGPMGFIDMKTFSHGSEALAKLIGARSGPNLTSIVGGGETIQLLNRTEMAKYISFISTGGGAMLTFLEGKILPSLKPLIIKR